MASSLLPSSVEPSAPNHASVRRRRWYQFSLRTLTITVVAISVALGLFAIRLRRARKQAAAVARIQKAGGSVGYDIALEQDTDGRWIAVDDTKSPVPTILLRWLGRDFFHSVITAELCDVSAPGADLKLALCAVVDLPKLEQLMFVPREELKLGRSEVLAIAKCRRLRRLTLWDADCGSDLRHLETLPRLDTLALGTSSTSDTALKAVARLRGLRQLHIDYGRITDRGLDELRALNQLEHLQLYGTPITGTGAHWPPSLKKVDFWETSFSDAGLATLADCRLIDRLNLADTRVTDSGLALLASLPNLRWLDLHNTGITDDGLIHLGQLKNLRYLSLSGIKLSSDGTKHLKHLQSLESLDLSGTFVDGEFDWPAGLQQVDLDNSCLTDKGLLQLARCPKLRSASFGDTLTTADGRKAFAKARPDVR